MLFLYRQILRRLDDFRFRQFSWADSVQRNDNVLEAAAGLRADFPKTAAGLGTDDLPTAAAGLEFDWRFNAVQRDDDVFEAAAGSGADDMPAAAAGFEIDGRLDAVQRNDNAFETAAGGLLGIFLDT